MDRREHHRAQLRLPVRIRWNTPFGQKTEICKTLDISRGGLLVPCEEEHAAGVSLWVTFPFDPAVSDSQPEMPAQVVRMRPAHNGNGNGSGSRKLRAEWHENAVGLRFALPFRADSNGNGHRKERERRESPRRPLAVPVRVRLEHMPWFEEAMTMEISAHGLRFLSSREYQAGDLLRISFEPAASGPWPATPETRARVVRTQAVPGSASLAVTIARES